MISAEQMALIDEDEDRSDALPPGTALLNGQYFIDRYLSSGGFGITYHARDSLDRPVVIKECYPEALCCRKAKTVRVRSSVNVREFQSLVAMFVREARSIAKLNNPNIVGVHQVFEDNDTAYMALDLIEGEDLLRVMETDPESLTPRIISDMLRKLLNAIAAVHAVDMLHRDISPDNILLDKWGNPILIDFGAAREQASKKSRAISAMLVVKDGYSPQEFYISGSRQGPWSDLYSLAATFHHLVSGEAPPNSQNRLAALASKRPDPYEPLLGRFDGYDNAFLRAIDRAMNVFPQDRFQSAKEWLSFIDTGHCQESHKRYVQSEADIQMVVARLLDQVGDLRTIAPVVEPVAALLADEPVKPFERDFESFPVAEQCPVPLIPAINQEPFLWFEIFKKRDAMRQRKQEARRAFRRFGVLIMVCAAAVAVIEHPGASIASIGVPDVATFIELGQYYMSRSFDLFSL